MTSTSVRTSTLRLDDPDDSRFAATALAAGAVVGLGFANVYAITSRSDAASVRRVNGLKGRPSGQVASITTTRSRIPDVWDWDRLPVPLNRRRVLSVIDTFFELGPFGFRGPAASHIPAHLTRPDARIPTVQLVGPGYECPSNDFLARAADAADDALLCVTSANRSRQLTGTDDAPAHWRAAGVREEFGDRLLMLEHDEEAASRRYRVHQPMSTTILGFHRLGFPVGGRPSLVLERHGSLHVSQVRDHLDELGFGLTVGPHAGTRLGRREYDAAGTSC